MFNYCSSLVKLNYKLLSVYLILYTIKPSMHEKIEAKFSIFSYTMKAHVLFEVQRDQGNMYTQKQCCKSYLASESIVRGTNLLVSLPLQFSLLIDFGPHFSTNKIFMVCRSIITRTAVLPPLFLLAGNSNCLLCHSWTALHQS